MMGRNRRLKFLQYRETQDDFSYDRIKERRLYKSSLKQLSGDEARKCLANFEVNLADFALASDSGLRLPLGALAFYYFNKTSLNVDNFWKTVDKKLHENEIELENVDYAKHALKDTNNVMQLIRAVTNNRTIGLLKHRDSTQEVSLPLLKDGFNPRSVFALTKRWVSP
ncbi:hypothetical protein C2G38_2253975 [Gigaspora rosea]|uniref:Uncharacterized protein n=1 Tax=Gigaspora rosea TaxID=44941 RepID=A0A397UDD2_9GLOM|nr:hypothetical protein C2G38_2253975 [Gigaspora rosea]